MATGSAAPEWTITLRHCASAGTVRARVVTTPLNRVDDVHGGYVSYHTRTGDSHHTILFGCVIQVPVRCITLTLRASPRTRQSGPTAARHAPPRARIHQRARTLCYRVPPLLAVLQRLGTRRQGHTVPIATSLSGEQRRAVTWLSNYRVCHLNQLGPPMLNVAPPGSHRSNLQRRRHTSHF